MNTTTLKDISEVQQAQGSDSLRRVIDQNQRPFVGRNNQSKTDRDLPEIVDVMDFLDTPLVKPPELIRGILHQGSKCILSGGSKTRKTWSLTHLGMCVATGQPWWGFPTTRGRVLYANFEIGAPFFQDRVNAIKDKLMIEGKNLKGRFHLWNLRGHAADISVLVDTIITKTKDKYDLIILDPIYKVLGDRDENSNGDIASMMNELDRIVEETGAAVMFGHHFSKGNQSKKDSIDRMSGAGAFGRDADSLLSLTKHEQPDTFTVDITVRNHKPVDSFCVTVEHPIMVRNDALDPTKVKKINGTEKKYTIAQLMKVLNIQQLSRAEMERQFKTVIGASEGTFDKLFKEAQIKDIEKCDEGRKWKAVNPVFPPGYNACKDQEHQGSATVQNSAIAPSAPC